MSYPLSKLAFWALLIGVAAGCDGGVDTADPADQDNWSYPFNLSKLHSELDGDLVRIYGEPGALVSTFGITAVNLEDPNKPSVATIEDDGSFEVAVLGRDLQRVRLEATTRWETTIVDLGVKVPDLYHFDGCGIHLSQKDRHEFGDVAVGQSDTLELTLENRCGTSLVTLGTRALAASDAFKLDMKGVKVIAPNTPITVGVTFTPTAAGETQDYLMLALREHAAYILTVRGSGVPFADTPNIP